jgi:NADH:ubiquinone oxidoreductase subunit E/NAD-dependent dihydropyrimidine dehydrogenase PreA subunit
MSSSAAQGAANSPASVPASAKADRRTDHGPANVPCGAVLVCGGGVAGIQASLDLAAGGFRVYLVEESPTIGGSMARLDKTFPTGDCATCIISPKLVECMRDYNVDVLTMADVTALEGKAGHFVAEVRKRPRSVDPAKCTGCGDCWTVCPVRNTAESPPPFQPSTPLNENDAARLSEILARHDGERGGMLPVLQEINHAYGYIPRGMLEHLACLWGLRLAEILRVASFYDRFHLQPVGRHVVEVCAGTSCHAQGSRALLQRLERELGLRAGETDKAGRFTLRTVRCLGLCALSPAMKIAGQSFGRIDPDRVPAILEQFP